MATKQLIHRTARLVIDLFLEEELANDTLSGFCAYASYVLRACLRQLNIQTELVLGCVFNMDRPDDFGAAHCWLEHNGRILDITARQFRFKLPSVYYCSYRAAQNAGLRYVETCRNRAAVRVVNREWGGTAPLSCLKHIKRALKIVRAASQERAA